MSQTDQQLTAELPLLRGMLARLEGGAEKTAGLRENFEAKIKEESGERQWTGSKNGDGYPKIKDNGKLRLASHVALELTGREAPRAGQVVMHRDNKPGNLAPSNLRVGTQKQNLKTMRDQGRDRPRGVAQQPDVKTAMWRAFGDELDRLLVG